MYSRYSILQYLQFEQISSSLTGKEVGFIRTEARIEKVESENAGMHLHRLDAHTPYTRIPQVKAFPPDCYFKTREVSLWSFSESDTCLPSDNSRNQMLKVLPIITIIGSKMN